MKKFFKELAAKEFRKTRKPDRATRREEFCLDALLRTLDGHLEVNRQTRNATMTLEEVIEELVEIGAMAEEGIPPNASRIQDILEVVTEVVVALKEITEGES